MALAKDLMDALKQGQTNLDDPGNREGRYMMGGMRQKLDIAQKDPAYHYHWFKDDGSRIHEALRAGYIPVLKTGKEFSAETPVDMDQWMTQRIDRNDSGAPVKGYLMKIRKEIYEADQAEKQREIDKIDEAILGGTIGDDQAAEHAKGTTYSDIKIDNQFNRN